MIPAPSRSASIRRPFNLGESATLTWQTRLADTVTIQPATGSIETSGSIQVSPAETTTYVITAAGPFGRAEKTVTLYVGTGPPTVTLNATPELIVSGESSTLTWESVHADTVTIAPDIGSVDPTGSITVSPPASTTYTITATGPEGEHNGRGYNYRYYPRAHGDPGCRADQYPDRGERHPLLEHPPCRYGQPG